MKIAFFGTPEFAGKILSWMLEYPEIEIALVVSQPDKAVWRKKELQPTAVKKIALENWIEVMQPTSINSLLQGEVKLQDLLKKLNLDFIVVVAYGKIIPTSILEIPKYWCINLHGSLLPKYRWASPVQASVKAWDWETWLTTMFMSKWMDEGDMLLTEKIAITAHDTSLNVFRKFSEVWPNLLRKTLVWVVSWEIQWIPQDESEATYCWKIIREDGEVFFQKQSSQEIYDTYRAYTPWPGIYTWHEGKRFVLEEVRPRTITQSWILSLPEEKGATENLQPHFSCKDEWENERSDYLEVKALQKIVWVESCENWERCLAKAWAFLKLAKNRYGIICSDWEIIEVLQVKLEWKKSTDIQSFVNGNKEVLEYRFE